VLSPVDMVAGVIQPSPEFPQNTKQSSQTLKNPKRRSFPYKEENGAVPRGAVDEPDSKSKVKNSYVFSCKVSGFREPHCRPSTTLTHTHRKHKLPFPPLRGESQVRA